MVLEFFDVFLILVPLLWDCSVYMRSLCESFQNQCCYLLKCYQWQVAGNVQKID